MPNSSILAFFQLEFSFMELLGEFFMDDGESVEFFGDGGEEVAREGAQKVVENFGNLAQIKELVILYRFIPSIRRETSGKAFGRLSDSKLY